MTQPRNGNRPRNGAAPNGVALTRKVDRLLVLARQSAGRELRILKLLEKKPAPKRRRAG